MAEESLMDVPGLDVLGKGYDATGEYADVGSLRSPIFDLTPHDARVAAPNGKVYKIPQIILDSGLFADKSGTKEYSVSGETAEEYLSNLRVDTSLSAGYGLFSGSVKTQFSHQERASLNHTFVTLFSFHHLWLIALPDLRMLKRDCAPKFDPVKGSIDATLAGVEALRFEISERGLVAYA